MSGVQKLSEMPSSRLRQLHRGVIGDRREIIGLLERARSNDVVLNNGVDRKSEPRIAHIRDIADDMLTLDAPNLRADGQPQIYLHFELQSTRYFFAAPPVSGGGESDLMVEIPAAIYEAERRDLVRVLPSPEKAAPRIVVKTPDGEAIDGVLRDWSYQGIGIAVDSSKAGSVSDRCVVSVEEGDRAGESRFAVVRRREPDGISPAWTRIGLEASAVAPTEPLQVEKRDSVLGGGLAQNAWRKISLVGAMAKRLPAGLRRSDADADQIEAVSYLNNKGETIRGLVDGVGEGSGGVAVVIPPAWGRTKESFLALSRAMCAAFEKAGMSATILRFDGTNRRGESHIDEACRAPGDEYLHFEFSQAVEDIRSSLQFARETFSPTKLALVSFSLGSVEARRAAVLEGDALDAWVSVVGMVDLQSGLRTVSGGLDFAYGQSIGIEFGRHELVGVVADMDRTGKDAFEHDLVFLEDAKRDMARLSLPISWIHGRYDAWMELPRVQALMAAGQSENRRLLEIPSGHQMRTSSEALQTFQLVGVELIRMITGEEIEPGLPDLADLERRNRLERERRPFPELDRHGFWSDYLLGRDRRLGFELMSAASPYRGLMNLQISRLKIEPSNRVLDLGGGTGDFAVNLAESGEGYDAKLIHLDLVPDALKRGRERVSRIPEASVDVHRLAADLEVASDLSIPLVNQSFDRILASLVLSYVDDPDALLLEIFRLTRRGGRLVLSSMRRDADISRIYANSLAELPPDRRESHFGTSSSRDFDELQRVFLNDAAKLLQMEEEGRFRFYDRDELASLVESAGFEVLNVDESFGEPAQAVVVTARRPDQP